MTRRFVLTLLATGLVCLAWPAAKKMKERNVIAASVWDIEVAARTVWGEARGKPPVDDLGVAYVIVNRWRAGKWFSGSRLADVCLLPEQFSCWNERDPNRRKLIAVADDDPELMRCRQLVMDAIQGAQPDPTHGATHYFADTIRAPGWTKKATKTAQLGPHIFYKGIG